jgi:DNA polymerase III delta prime subunit
MSELTDLLFIEKYRPKIFNELILKDKQKLEQYIQKPASLPSFIFYSFKPGTGKTSCAKVIINTLDCDHRIINSSQERGIDTIREQVTRFAMGLKSNESKRCVFLDEADGLTPPAQNSLRNLMETYSDNCFFIFSCNDINRIIEPIRSRCIEFNFENPVKEEIYLKLKTICEKEEIVFKYAAEARTLLSSLVDYYYPDIRSMIKKLQEWKLTGKCSVNFTEDFEMFLDAIERKDIDYIIKATYSNQFDITAWNKWYFKKVFDSAEKLGLDKCIAISELLADTEKNWHLGSNLEVIFLSNMFKLMTVL